MQPQQNLSGSNGATDQSAIVCTQCGSPMPKEMRFCRSCGNRLGEGPAEYTETVRFRNVATANAQFNPAYIPPAAAPIAPKSSCDFARRRRRVGWGGMTWLWIVIAVFFASGGAMSILKGPRRGRATTAVFLDRSIFGVDGFKTTEGGVTFEGVEPPGADGVLWAPYLMGERTPHCDPHTRAALIGLAANHGRGHLVRAVLAE